MVLGPGIGRDVAVIDNGAEGYLLAKTDPVTFATDAIGYYVVNVNANDIATSGGRPRWFLATALLPENAATEAMVAELFHQITNACEALGVALVRGTPRSPTTSIAPSSSARCWERSRATGSSRRMVCAPATRSS